jgi:alkyldihydroxyacetonephosphate synthase
MTASLAEGLAAAVPGLATSDEPTDRTFTSRDLWPRHHIAVRDGDVALHSPGAIAWPRTTEDVARVVAWCAERGVPIQPFGAGSGVCGGTLPDRSTLVLDLKRMKQWRAFDPDLATVDVESGAMGIRLEEDLDERGYTLGHFPSSILCSTVGGWVAARSAGQCSGLYGKIEDMVLSVECVVGRGEVVTFHRRAEGPDLTPIVIGSEGVLGVVTSTTLRLHPRPPARTFGAFSFPTVEAGWEAIRDMFQAGLRPAVCRLYDAFDSWMAKRGLQKAERRAGQPPKPKKAPGAGFAALRTILRVPGVLNSIIDGVGEGTFGGATLVLIFESPAEAGRADMERAREIARRGRGRDLGEGPARHWLSHRYSVSYRQAPMFMSGSFADTMEVAAPWSRLGDLYRAVRAALGKHVFVMAHLSHAYPDGCSIYFTFAGSAPDRPSTEALYDRAWRSAMDAAIGAGGTLSHHHGVGRSKAPALGAELGLGVDVVHALRHAFDPAGIFNPKNLMPREGSPVRKTPPAPTEMSFDERSLLLTAPGEATVADVEDDARRRGTTLGIPLDRLAGVGSKTVATWLAEGAPGASDLLEDPVDHLVAGFSARLGSGARLDVRNGPRRAVGPDLYALFHGQRERTGAIDGASLRVHRETSPPARRLETGVERQPAIGEAEQAWNDKACDAAAGVRER